MFFIQTGYLHDNRCDENNGLENFGSQLTEKLIVSPQDNYVCNFCGKDYKWLKSLTRHQWKCRNLSSRKYLCTLCNAEFFRGDHLSRHHKLKHNCEIFFTRNKRESF